MPKKERTNAEPRNAVQRILAFNRGRDPERLALKYRAMQHDPFVFFRGTCHLFYEDLPRDRKLFRAPPLAWICGDLHFQNFGSYKGDNRLAYFDVNDFDEGCLAPVTWELARFLTSLHVGADTLKLKRRTSRSLGRCFLDAYAAALVDGKARWIERDIAIGMIRDLLEAVRSRSRRDLLEERTGMHKGRRRLRTDGDKAFPASKAERERISAFVRKFAATESDPDFFRVLDCARRIAGTGSLGIERYVILVAGKGSPDDNYLLDLKHQPGSAVAPRLQLQQPKWASEAQRAVAIQQRCQAIAPALLRALRLGKRSYTLRELMPSQDRLELESWNGDLARLECAVADMGRLIAWADLRSAARDGAATPDALIAFGRAARKWAPGVLDYAAEYAERVESDWSAFRAADAAVASALAGEED